VARHAKTGMSYAKAFLPMMTFNAGAASLGHIVSHMAIAGRDTARTKAQRGIDDIALGFMMGIGGSLQSAIASVAIGVTAIEMPESDLSRKFLALDKGGHALDPLRRDTLFHDPNANIMEVSRS
jgi:hypothetical protein